MGQEVALTEREENPRRKLNLLMRRLKPKARQALRLMMSEHLSVGQAAARVRAGRSSVAAWLGNPVFREAHDLLVDMATQEIGVSAAYVLGRTKQVVERCMQAEPVRDEDGQPTGEYVFDSKGALRGLDMLGKHRKLWGDEKTYDRVPTVVLNVGVRGGTVTVSGGAEQRIPVLPKVTRGP